MTETSENVVTLLTGMTTMGDDYHAVYFNDELVIRGDDSGEYITGTLDALVWKFSAREQVIDLYGDDLGDDYFEGWFDERESKYSLAQVLAEARNDGLRFSTRMK